jgi:hypothetical protein
VAGKEVTLVTEEVHRVHDPSGPPSSAALSVSGPMTIGPSSSPRAGPGGTSLELCRTIKIRRIVSTMKL